MLPWSSFTTTCSNFLAHSDYALEADSYLVAWSEMQHIAEDCGQYFAFDDPTVPPMSDPRLQLTLKGFEKRLEDWKKCVDVRLMTPSLAMHFYQNKIFLQEFAIMVKELDLDNTGAGGALNRRAAGVLPNMESARTNPISPASSNAILVIIESAHASLNAMISMSELVLRSIPVINYVRMAYALVMLIKMSATAVAPGSELGKILAIDSLKVDYYIKEVVARLKAIADYRVAAKFLQVVVKVGMWHYRHMCLTGVKVGQGHQELMEPLLNLVVADDEVEGCPYAREENERKRKETAEKEGKNTPIGRGAYGTHLEHYEGPADGPAPDPFQMGRFNFEQSPNSAPNTAPSSTSNPQSQEQQFSSELQSALGQPGPGQDMQGEWLNGMEQFNIGNGLLPSEMDVDIFALTEGMEFSTADLNSFLPIVENQYAPNGGLGDVGGYNGQNWQWNG